MKLGGRSDTIVSTDPSLACNRAHDPIGANRCNPAYRIVACVSHIDIARRVGRDRVRKTEPSGAIRSISSALTPGKTCYRAYHTCRCNLSNREVGAIRHINVAIGVRRNTLGVEELRVATYAVGPAAAGPPCQSR